MMIGDGETWVIIGMLALLVVWAVFVAGRG
jgi:hypothetical protein